MLLLKRRTTLYFDFFIQLYLYIHIKFTYYEAVRFGADTNGSVSLESQRVCDGVHVTRRHVDALDVADQAVTTRRAFEEDVATGEVPDSRDRSEYWQ